MQFSLTVNGEYAMDSDSLSDYSYFLGSFVEDFGKLGVGADYILLLYSTPTLNGFKIMSVVYGKSDLLEVKAFYFSNSLLNGMVLNQEENTALKLKRYVRGGLASFKLRNLEFGFLTGTPFNYDFDGRKFSLVSDTFDVFRGVFGNFEKSWVKLEWAYLRLNRKNMPSPSSFQEIFGGGVELGSSFLQFNLLGARKWGVDPITYGRIKGSGVFGLLAIGKGAFNTYVSGLLYDSLNFWNYNAPPFVTEREILPSGGDSDKGIGLGFSFAEDGFILEGKAGSVVSLGEENLLRPKEGKAYQEQSLKMDFLSLQPLSLSISSGRELFKGIEPEYELLRSFYFEVAGESKFGLPLDFEVRPSFNIEDDKKYVNFLSQIGIKALDKLGFSLVLEYNSVKLDRFQGENFWAFGEIKYEVDNGFVTLGFDSQKGGLVCAGGICRYYPPFKGLRLGISVGM